MAYTFIFIQEFQDGWKVRGAKQEDGLWSFENLSEPYESINDAEDFYRGFLLYKDLYVDGTQAFKDGWEKAIVVI